MKHITWDFKEFIDNSSIIEDCC